jgi:hypothetical protein
MRPSTTGTVHHVTSKIQIDRERPDDGEQKQDAGVVQSFADICAKGHPSKAQKPNPHRDAKADEIFGEGVLGDIQFGSIPIPESKPKDVLAKQMERDRKHQAGKREWIEASHFHSVLRLTRSVGTRLPSLVIRPVEAMEVALESIVPSPACGGPDPMSLKKLLAGHTHFIRPQ